MQSNRFIVTAQNLKRLYHFVLAGLFALSTVSSVLAQTRSEVDMENKIRLLLKSEEFKDSRTELIAMGDQALLLLFKIFEESSNDEELVRIMSVLRGSGGDKRGFLPKITVLINAPNPTVQTAALMTLGEIGGVDQAKPLEEIVMNKKQREAARINAARALARIGTKQSIAVIETALRIEREKPRDKALIEALQISLVALRERHKQ